MSRSEPERKVYMTYPFHSAFDYSKLEEMVRDSLARARFPVDSVQCPLGNNGVVFLAMREHAVAFNRQLQITVVDLKWAP